MMRSACAALVAMVMWSVPGMLFAQVVRSGPEFQVNTYTTREQTAPTACRDAAGNFVVAWRSQDQDGSSGGVFAERFSSGGAALGTEFQVNTYTTYSQYDPAVCCAASGDFVVVWSSYRQDRSDGGVFGQRFASSGAMQGTEFQVNTYTPSYQNQPALSCDPSGGFVVVWSSYQDGDDKGVFAQRFASTGGKQGTEFQVNTYTEDYQDRPAISCDTAGNFVVVWESYGQDGNRKGLFARRFNNIAMAVGTEFQVNTYTTDTQRRPAVGCDPAGNFVVAWQSYQDGANLGIFAQRFASTGAAQGTEFQVNSYTTDYQDDPALCVDPQGNFLVAWDSGGQDGNRDSVFGRRFSAAGNALGGEFPINTYTPGNQHLPTIACGTAGNFVVAWQSDFAYADRSGPGTAPGTSTHRGGAAQGVGFDDGIAGQDGDEAGIFAQRFTTQVAAQAPALGPVALGLTGLGLLLTGAVVINLRRRRKT